MPVLYGAGQEPDAEGHLYAEIVSDDAALARAKSFILDGLESSGLQSINAKVFPLEQRQDAHRYLEGNEQFGKIVVTV
jgi:NADPH:quinone reductase-like Zn-dependent oxidoreductase